MSSSAVEDAREKKSVRRRLRELIWDSLDRSPEERRFISKIDFYILSWAGLAYFSKNLNQNNVEPRPANAYISGMKEELNVVGNEYQTFTTMWTISRLRSSAPEIIEARLLTCTKADVFTQVRISIWCPSWELLWVLVTFTTAAVHNSQHLYACRFFVVGTQNTVHQVPTMPHLNPSNPVCLTELGKRACIFFASAFIGSMFSGYLQAALYSGMNGVGGLSGWRWLFIFDGIITLPMALWAYYALPDLPSNTRVRWLSPEEKQLALDHMKRAGKQLDEPFTLAGLRRILGKWHFWVYTAYYTFFICSENIGTYMNLWLKSLNRYTIPQINNFPTATNAITIVTTLTYGWVSDGLQIRAPIVYFSLTVCFFAAMNLAIWDGVPFGLKWASFYMTGQTMVNEYCAGDSLERKFILGTTNSIAYAFNAWIALVTYNTNYAPRFLVGNSVTAGLIICAATTLTAAVFLQRRDDRVDDWE
ncbi:MFS general substrate transporter [Apiospora hydei]|uniref:MFS general substrate transporter n=1 Tax=Apiospora hydei TaxID=1337664 RepID=A0ABR1VJE6_9PEZI